jgi:hypothetical protein
MGPAAGLQPRWLGEKRRLLAVVLQYLVAGRRYLGPVLLQAGEDHEVTLIDDVAAVALNVTVAGRLLFGRAAARRLGRRLGEGCRGRENESEGQDKLADKLAHEILQRQEIRTSESGFGKRHGFVGD